MYVLYPRDPARCQIGKIWQMPNEIVATRADKYIVCQKETTNRMLKRSGFLSVVTIPVKQAAKILGVPVPVVQKWSMSGKFPTFSAGDEVLVPLLEINKFKDIREEEKNA